MAATRAFSFASDSARSGYGLVRAAMKVPARGWRGLGHERLCGDGYAPRDLFQHRFRLLHAALEMRQGRLEQDAM